MATSDASLAQGRLPAAGTNEGIESSMRAMVLPPERDLNLAPKAAAQWLGVSEKTLRKWRNAKPHPIGPAFTRYGKTVVRYALSDLIAYRRTNTVRPGKGTEAGPR